MSSLNNHSHTHLYFDSSRQKLIQPYLTPGIYQLVEGCNSSHAQNIKTQQYFIWHLFQQSMQIYTLLFGYFFFFNFTATKYRKLLQWHQWHEHIQSNKCAGIRDVVSRFSAIILWWKQGFINHQKHVPLKTPVLGLADGQHSRLWQSTGKNH